MIIIITKRETESLLIAAQHNAIRTNSMKARIDKTEQNIKFSLCDDREKKPLWHNKRMQQIITEGV